ncbi:hypothetical protein [Methyloglobulus sp.]|uniref:hypothetical protein n=1 Tax=Methyloglobulus sp. TaxID=2518622 RepID=UPI0032B881AD
MNWKIILLIIVALLLYWIWHAPWEWRMRHNFNQHFAAFQKLEQMQRENIEVYYIGHENEHYENSRLGEERYSEYKKLLGKANLDHIIYINDEPKKRMVRFQEVRSLDAGGYVYMEYPPPKIFNSFKECKPIMPSESCFILLQKNWYLYSEKFRMEQPDAK